MGVNFLLDTHVFLWLLASPERIPTSVVTELEDRRNGLFVSAVSAYEVARKVGIGRLQAPGLVERWEERVRQIGAESVSLTPAQAALAGSMPWDHRDPFDRMLLAQAAIEDYTLVTVDQHLRSVSGQRILSW